MTPETAAAIARRAHKPNISREELLSLVRYENGRLYWLKSRSSNAGAGREVGYITNKGYRIFWLNGWRILVHRAVWLIHTGRWPSDQIDHINGRRDDNRIENLRECNCSQNHAAKLKPSRKNQVGYRGVSMDGRPGRGWRATIHHNGRQTFLGYFDSPEEAALAYDAAAISTFGEFARPNFQIGSRSLACAEALEEGHE